MATLTTPPHLVAATKTTLIVMMMGMMTMESVALDLSEVPAQLREKILQFHRVLDTPDNFSTTSAPPPESPRYPLAGLAEDAGDHVKISQTEPLELQADLFRFSGRLSPPPATEGLTPPTQNILECMRESQSEMRRRLRTEWQQFLRWRRRQRQRRRMRRRIMKMLQRKLEKRFGPLPPSQWKTIQNNSVFRTTKRIIRKKIRRLMRKKMKKRKMAKEGGQGGRKEKGKKARGRRKKKKERKKQRRQKKFKS